MLLRTFAEEGMFIPMLLGEQRIARMQSLGLRLTAADIYDVNNASLKDAIVLFGRGCTGVIVSDEGLLLTNHHCGFGTIQSHSTLDHDYLTSGFWAASRAEELVNPGLTVTLLVRMEEVTEPTLKGITEKMTEAERSKIIRENISRIEKEAVKEKYQDARVRSFYYGNQYFLFITETYKDVRLVGAPPSDIGDFGGDTDNWMWPRHTGDFSVFRIYADKDNKPAEYSKENVPFKPRKSIAVSLQGYERGDFTFVFGFPGSTREYLPAAGVEMIAFKENPVRIALRQTRLDIIGAAMDKDPLTRIQYASKHKGIANYWKKMIGETRGIRKMDAIAIKEHKEQGFLDWMNASPERKSRYGGLFPEFERTYSAYQPLSMASVYLTEAGMAIELVRFASGFKDLITMGSDKESKTEELTKEVQKMITSGRGFYKNYQAGIDREIASAMLPEMDQKMEQTYLPPILKEIKVQYKGDFRMYSEDLFKKSVFADSATLMKILGKGDRKQIARLSEDIGFKLASDISSILNKKVMPEVSMLNARLDSLQRIYLSALMEMGSTRFSLPGCQLHTACRLWCSGYLQSCRCRDLQLLYDRWRIAGKARQDDTRLCDD